MTSSGSTQGQAIVSASWWGTALFTVTAVAATIWSELRLVAAVVALGLFGIGCVVFLVAFAIAVARSTTDAIGIGGLYFLAGSSPASIRRRLLGALAVQVIVALVTASIRIFTSLAFGVLVPIFGLGQAGLWAARYGRFEPRA